MTLYFVTHWCLRNRRAHMSANCIGLDIPFWRRGRGSHTDGCQRPTYNVAICNVVHWFELHADDWRLNLVVILLVRCYRTTLVYVEWLELLSLQRFTMTSLHLVSACSGPGVICITKDVLHFKLSAMAAIETHGTTRCGCFLPVIILYYIVLTVTRSCNQPREN